MLCRCLSEVPGGAAFGACVLALFYDFILFFFPFFERVGERTAHLFTCPSNSHLT